MGLLRMVHLEKCKMETFSEKKKKAMFFIQVGEQYLE